MLSLAPLPMPPAGCQHKPMAVGPGVIPAAPTETPWREMQTSLPATCMLGSISVGRSPAVPRLTASPSWTGSGQAASACGTASSPRAHLLELACGAICIFCGWYRCSHCKTSTAVPSPPSDTLSFLASIPKLADPRTPASHLTACWLHCGRGYSGTAKGDPMGPGGSHGARLPSPLLLSSSAPTALCKLHKYSW